MSPRNIRSFFLFQAVVGLASFVSVLTMGRTGLALIAFLALRPFVFGRTADDPGDPVRRLHRRTFRISLAITAAALSAAWVALEAGLTGDVDRWMLLLLLVPAYMLVHGTTGFVLSGRDDTMDHPRGPYAGERGDPR